jgi:hypothetical protein
MDRITTTNLFLVLRSTVANSFHHTTKLTTQDALWCTHQEPDQISANSTEIGTTGRGPGRMCGKTALHVVQLMRVNLYNTYSTPQHVVQ